MSCSIKPNFTHFYNAKRALPAYPASSARLIMSIIKYRQQCFLHLVHVDKLSKASLPAYLAEQKLLLIAVTLLLYRQTSCNLRLY